MRHSIRFALVAALGVAGLAAFTADVPPETVVLEGASHSVTIEYLEDSGDYRRAQVTVQPVRGGDRPAWRGEARSFQLVGSGTLSRRDRARFSRTGISTTHILSSGFGNTVVMVAPSRQTLAGIVVTTTRGAAIGFALPGRGGESSRDGDPDEPPPEEPKPDPEPEPEPDPDPPGDDFDNCPSPNPWDCVPIDRWPGPSGALTGNDRAVSFTF